MSSFPFLAIIAVLNSASADLGEKSLEVVNRTARVSAGEVQLNASPGAGLAWVKGLEVNEGCLELDVKGSNEYGRSFVGLAFRAANENIYDAVYLRPFVFQSDDPAAAANGVQYMSMPDFGWPVLRERSPGIYEKSIGSKPSPDDWVHLRVQFGRDRLQAFVNHASTPQLDLPLLTQQTAGRVALWVGNNSSGSFRRLQRCDKK